MKKLLLIAMAAFTTAAMALSLADAKAQIPGVIASPGKAAEIMKQLSEEDQDDFLAALNEAIDAMPGSIDEKAALFLSVNEAALKAHGPNNLKALLATTFATIPVEVLTVISESFAKDLFNRNADPSMPISNDDYLTIARSAVEAVAARAELASDSAVRTAFAIIMFARASEGTIPGMIDTLAQSIKDPDVRQIAVSEWIPAALGQQSGSTGAQNVAGQQPGSPSGTPNYDPILGASDAGSQPSVQNVLSISSPEMIVPLVSDLGNMDPAYTDTTFVNMSTIGFPETSQTVMTNPNASIPDTPWNSDSSSNSNVPPQEPDYYPFQS